MIDTTLFASFHRVALAVSGGKDSMALLCEFARSFEHDFFYVVNIEHGIRGEESISDSQFVVDYCKSLGVEVISYRVDAVAYSKENGYTLEQGARLLRREIFRREVCEGRADRVVVAHHMDDNVESILMHIFRGSGMRGLKGMAFDDGLLLRPLLMTSRQEIEEYIKTNGIPYREDSTNSDTDYRRNFVRLSIMPRLKEVYPTIDESISRLASNVRCDEEYLEELSKEYITYDGNRVLVDTKAPDVLFKRCIYDGFCHLEVNYDVEDRHYNLLLDLKGMRNGTTLDMPYGVRATLEYGKIALYRDEPSFAENIPFSTGVSHFGSYDILVSEVSADEVTYDANDKSVLFVDGDELDGAIIRTRMDGDMFKAYAGHTKKLKDYLIDKKIPRTLRDMPLVANGSEILVIVGVEIADRVKITPNTHRILKIELRRC